MDMPPLRPLPVYWGVFVAGVLIINILASLFDPDSRPFFPIPPSNPSARQDMQTMPVISNRILTTRPCNDGEGDFLAPRTRGADPPCDGPTRVESHFAFFVVGIDVSKRLPESRRGLPRYAGREAERRFGLEAIQRLKSAWRVKFMPAMAQLSHGQPVNQQPQPMAPQMTTAQWPPPPQQQMGGALMAAQPLGPANAQPMNAMGAPPAMPYQPMVNTPAQPPPAFSPQQPPPQVQPQASPPLPPPPPGLQADLCVCCADGSETPA
ncbi:unnamed protein product [Vitrella brassicaformis CCMP3155]|uniref:Uncharacterized protein n=1 Tax=Vitrella brassicaformis (strain CCMP3155) TaxID=1169540 RepID=A0A0G4FYF8_VITBC|nr:unnamed protein product [Vitrella brassicaformis CCMP3155]|eukprot:CEM20213.1 unnamed protein product [Vitrella brassicaformis CCMP3155]